MFIERRTHKPNSARLPNIKRRVKTRGTTLFAANATSFARTDIRLPLTQDNASAYTHHGFGNELRGDLTHVASYRLTPNGGSLKRQRLVAPHHSFSFIIILFGGFVNIAIVQIRHSSSLFYVQFQQILLTKALK